jgi:hypothetical protein
VLDELADELGRHGTVEDEGVPVLLVHVPAGFDGLVLVAKLQGALGIALQVDAGGVVLRHGDGEELATDFVHEGFRSKRLRFLGGGEAEAKVDDIGEVHEEAKTHKVRGEKLEVRGQKRLF